MANPFVRGWKYFMALLSGKLDEHSDPKIQIQQAIEEAQRSHQQLTQQAAAVIGNQRQLEMLTQVRRGVADVATSRKRVELLMRDAGLQGAGLGVLGPVLGGGVTHRGAPSSRTTTSRTSTRS